MINLPRTNDTRWLDELRKKNDALNVLLGIEDQPKPDYAELCQANIGICDCPGCAWDSNYLSRQDSIYRLNERITWLENRQCVQVVSEMAAEKWDLTHPWCIELNRLLSQLYAHGNYFRQEP